MTAAAMEPLTLAAMLLAFAVLAVGQRWPIGLALVVAAWVGAALNGDLVPGRHLVEGAFSYLDPVLVIATAMIFMRVLADGGALDAIGLFVERRFGTRPSILLPVLMLIVMFPGMITGSSTASVLTTGAMVASILIGLGLSRERTAALVAMGGVLGMVAPPINIPAMLIGTGIDLPYAGFAAPLALASFPLALVLAYAFGWPLVVRRQRPVLLGAVSISVGGVAGPPSGLPDAALAARAVPAITLPAALAAPLFAALLMAAPRIWPMQMPDPGLPLTFLLATALAVVVRPAGTPALLQSGGSAAPERPAGTPALLQSGGSAAPERPAATPALLQSGGSPAPLQQGRTPALLQVGSRLAFAWRASLRGVEEALPVLGILTGVGAFIQVMTLTGARGWLVALMVGAPSWAVFAAAGASIPLFGAVSAFGSASVLGVPFLLALLGRDEVVTTAALSLLAALGDLMLPAALAATLAAQVAGVADRRRVLRLCVPPAAAAVAVAILMLVYSTAIGRLLR